MTPGNVAHALLRRTPACSVGTPADVLSGSAAQEPRGVRAPHFKDLGTFSALMRHGLASASTSVSEGRWLFVTFNLHGSLPKAKYPPANKLSAGQAFVWMDQPIASLLTESRFRGVELGQYLLGPFVLIANYVHTLLLPLTAPNQLLKSLTGYTAREAKRRNSGR